MKSLLILKHVQVQNANAIAGLTWGFPGITNFLGFTHALSRYAEKIQGVRFDGCAVVCHSHQVQAHQPTPYGEYVFALTRNPLTKEGKPHLSTKRRECTWTSVWLSNATLLPKT